MQESQTSRTFSVSAYDVVLVKKADLFNISLFTGRLQLNISPV
jgi:hypothetical protein